MSTTDFFDFIISPEPRYTTVDMTAGNYVDIAFVVRNVSGRTVRAEALINPLPESNELANPPAPPELWIQHLRILNSEEWEFEHGAVRTYTARLELPKLFPSGSYRFQLLIVGTDDPDNQVVVSDVVTFTVSGPLLNVRPYLLAAVAILAAIIALAVGAALFLRPPAQLQVVFEGGPPNKQMIEGTVESYTLKISNLRQEPLENLMLNYDLPPGLISASAFVQDSPMRNCEKSLKSLHCDLGRLLPGVPVFVTIEILPGPVPGTSIESTAENTLVPTARPTVVPMVEIEHLKTMTFARQLEGKIVAVPVDLPQATSAVTAGGRDVYLAIDPEQLVALTGEVLHYDIVAWSHSPLAGSFTLTYELPRSLTYKLPLPTGCSQEQTDYFKLVCSRDSIPVARQAQDVLRIPVQAVAPAPAQSLEHKASLEYKVGNRASTGELPEGSETPIAQAVTGVDTTTLALPAAASLVSKTIEATATTSAVSTALMFDGVDDWVQLGFSTGLPTFTAEMWVHPFSTDDGQAFISIHRQRGTNKVDNLFSVGYYEGRVSVEVNGEYYYLDREKIDQPEKIGERFHLAVVVEKLQEGSWQAIVYINGQAQPWQKPEPDPEGECTAEGVAPNHCRWFNSPIPERAASKLDGAATLPWSLGQEWDDGSSGPRASDFFYGSLADVHLWNIARTQDQILAGMNRRLQGDEDGLVGYWPLEPVEVSSDTLADRASGQYPGTRHQANWDDITPRFGAALAFDGFDDSLLVDDLHLSSFTDGADGKVDGKVELTMAGWFYVDGVPTRQQWLLGSAAPGFGLGQDETAQAPAATTVQTELSQAQAELVAALQARQALSLDSAVGQAALQAARDELYGTLNPFKADFDPITYNTPLTTALKNAPNVLTTRLDDLIKARREPPELMELRQAKRNLEREESLYTQASKAGVDFAILRSAFRTEAARRAYARVLVQVWQSYADNDVTEPGVLSTALDPPGAGFQEQINSLETGLKSQPLPVRALNSLAMLELNEANLAESLLSGELLTESSQARKEALVQAQTSFDTDLEQNETYLQSLLGLQSNPTGGAGTPAMTAGGPNLEDPNLVGYWKFDEGSGAFTAAYPDKGKPGQLSGGAAFISSAPALPANPFALAFDGAMAAVSMESPLLVKGVNDFTVAFWINPQSPGQVVYIETGSSPNTGTNFTCFLLDVFALNCAYAGQAVAVDLAGYRNTWVHVAFHYGGGSLSGYVNGAVQLDLSTVYVAPTQAVNLSRALRLGNLPGNFTAFTGLLDELLIYQSALPPEEIARIAGSLPSGLETSQSTLQRLAALRAVQALRQAQENLDAVIAADARLAQAQRTAEQASASVELQNQTAADAHQDYKQFQARQTEVIEAQAAVESATPADRAAAQKRLEKARADLEAARQQQFQDLDLSITLLGERELILAALNPRLDEAVEKSVDAAQAALQRNNVELLVGPYLDWILNTTTPRKTSYQAAYPAALLAAQLVLKPEADGKVDLARAKYDAAVAARDRVVNSSGKDRLQQSIIESINNYIKALNGEVELAKVELDKAVEEQKNNQSDSPLQSIMAEALAQSLAQRVTNEIAARYPVNPHSTVLPDPRLTDAIKTQLKAELFNSLENVRRPMRLRLYYETYYAIQRLDQEQAAGIDSLPERTAKTNLRARLMELNLAVLRVLEAQYALLRPAVGFEALLKQVADESDRATQMDQLLQALDLALKNASASLDVQELGIRLPSAGQENTNTVSAQGESTVPGGGTGAPAANAVPGTSLVSTPAAAVPSQNNNPPDGSLTGSTTTPGAGASIASDSGTPVASAGTNQPGGNQSSSNQPGASQPGGTTTPVGSAPTPGAGTSTSDGSGTSSPSATTGLATASPNIWAGLILTDDGHVAVVARPAGAATWAIREDERSIPVGRWVHFAAVIVYDASTGEIDVDPKTGKPNLNLYRNGGSAKGDPGWVAPDEIRVGSANCLPNFYIGGLCEGYNFRGKIDEVRIWNRGLAVGEIDGLRNLAGEASNEVAYWSYDQILGGQRPEGCELGQACDLAGAHNLNVIGPVWVPADPNLLRAVTSR